MTWLKARILVLSAAGALVLGPAAMLAGAHGRPHHHARSHHARRHQAGIPQHNGGDHDADNNGAPSDGDGNQ